MDTALHRLLPLSHPSNYTQEILLAAFSVFSGQSLISNSPRFLHSLDLITLRNQGSRICVSRWAVNLFPGRYLVIIDPRPQSSDPHLQSSDLHLLDTFVSFEHFAVNKLLRHLRFAPSSIPILHSSSRGATQGPTSVLGLPSSDPRLPTSVHWPPPLRPQPSEQRRITAQSRTAPKAHRAWDD